MTLQTNLHNCSNPAGFNQKNEVYCSPILLHNATAGLLLRNLKNTNQFLSIYVNFEIDTPDLSNFLSNRNVFIMKINSHRSKYPIKNVYTPITKKLKQ